MLSSKSMKNGLLRILNDLDCAGQGKRGRGRWDEKEGRTGRKEGRGERKNENVVKKNEKVAWGRIVDGAVQHGHG